MKAFIALLISILTAINASIAQVSPAAEPVPPADHPVCDTVVSSDPIEDAFLAEAKSVFGESANIQIYEPTDLDAETLGSRMENNVIIVEKYIGVVENDAGDGRIENAIDGFNYISYDFVPFQTEVGMRIVTYAVYNTENDYLDDVMLRYDYPVTESQP